MNPLITHDPANFLPAHSTPFLDTNDDAILQKLKKVKTGCFSRIFSRIDSSLKNDLNKITPHRLNQILTCFFEEKIKDQLLNPSHSIYPRKLLDQLACTIPFAQLEKAVKDVGIDESEVTATLTQAKEMLAEAKFYLQMTGNRASPTLKRRLSHALEGALRVLETLLTAFGIGDLFKPAENSWDADSKQYKIMSLIGFFNTIKAISVPLLGAAMGGIVIGALFASILALSIIWPLICPITSYLPANAENWTKQVQGSGFVAQGRKESLDAIATILKMNRHALLVGPSRVGKSLTAKAFAQAIANGDYPELKGKTVFRINTSDLVGQKSSFLGGADTLLKKISARMGRHRQDIILVLDEIHAACKNNDKLADQLKTFLDEGGEFAHVIGITTNQEYEQYVRQNDAFSLRFDKVNIENTSRAETLKILSDTLLKSRSKPFIEQATLDYIYAKSSSDEAAPQPTSAIKLLKKCIDRTEKTQQSSTEKKIIEVSNQLSSLRSMATAHCGGKEEIRAQVIELEKELEQLRKTLAKEKEELAKLFKAKDLLDKVTKETYQTVIKIEQITQKRFNAKTEEQLNLFLMLRQFLSPLLEKYIREKAAQLQVRAVIDRALIDEVAAER